MFFNKDILNMQLESSNNVTKSVPCSLVDMIEKKISGHLFESPFENNTKYYKIKPTEFEVDVNQGVMLQFIDMTQSVLLDI